MFGLIVLCMVAAMSAPYLAERRRKIRENLPRVNGKAVSTRVVKDPPTQRFTITMYVGECSVEYIVGGKKYALWARSGYLDPDLKFISDKMQECPVSRYVVQYNPQNASEAFAEQLDGPP